LVASVTEPLSEAQRTEVAELVRVELLPYRIRFYLMMTALVLVVLVAAFSYVRGQNNLEHAINDVTCSERGLVYHAIPLKPPARTLDGKPLHYTAAQIKERRLFRASLLSGLPPASCPGIG
jgi:hypothetical protein